MSYEWIDPWAIVAVHKEALAIERKAYELADKERKGLQARLRERDRIARIIGDWCFGHLSGFRWNQLPDATQTCCLQTADAIIAFIRDTE